MAAGTVNGKSNLHLLPAGRNRGKYLIKKVRRRREEEEKLEHEAAENLNQFSIWFQAQLLTAGW